MPLKKIFLFLFSVLGLVVVGSAQDSRIWATYYGGSAGEEGSCVATDTWGNVYLAGRTYSTTGIASGGFQNSIHPDWGDAFLVKFDSLGNRLWATYYGAELIDYSSSIAIDALGNVYLSGNTYPPSNELALGGFQNTIGGGIDAFLVKFDSTGNRLWATYYGGGKNDFSSDIAIDPNGNIYMAGQTSTDSGSIAIASGGFQNTHGNGLNTDAFLVKFNPAGSRLWATYYGGANDDNGYSVSTDASGNVYLAGDTWTTTGIASGGFQNTFGGVWDAFLVKFDSIGNRLWATYYGGTDEDHGYSTASDVNGNIYLAGNTYSTSDIALGGFQNTNNGADAFLVKFDRDGNRIWATYYGGSGDEEQKSIATDSQGNVYLAGDTYSNSGIASGGFQNGLIGTGNILNGIENEFVVKFDSSGTRLCATYYGQDHDEDGQIALDSFGNVYLAGTTHSVSGIANGGFQNIYGGGDDDLYLVKFTSCSSCQTSLIINISQNGDTLSATTAPNYQWYLNDTLILGATNQNYIIHEGGNYSVITSTDSCTFTSNNIETTCLCVGIDENPLFQSISLFPNPANEHLNIIVQLSNAEATTIKLTDAFGCNVYQKTETQKATSFNWQIPLSGFAAGIYFTEITVLGQKQYRKIAVQR